MGGVILYRRFAFLFPGGRGRSEEEEDRHHREAGDTAACIDDPADHGAR
jgi:hypothetical protein